MSHDESNSSEGGAQSVEHPEDGVSGDYVETLRKPSPDGEPVEHDEYPKPDAVSSDEASVPADWSPGDIILDQYEVMAELGAGTFGVVHKVHHKGWNVDMAVKSAIGLLSEKDVEAIHQEAEVWMELGLHPNIASCYFVRNLGGRPRIFVEYVGGGTLHEWLYGKTKVDEDGSIASLEEPRDLTSAQRLSIAIEICRGMHHTHTFQWKDKEGNPQDGVVHRDLKPLNILMTQDGIPRVTDFGLVGLGLPTGPTQSPSTPKADHRAQGTDAVHTLVRPRGKESWEGAEVQKPNDEDASPRSQSEYLDPRMGASRQHSLGGGVAGTPQYMAPEQWDRHAHPMKASDIYAFGVILYELFCGRRPFELPSEYAHMDPKHVGAFYEPLHREQPAPDPASLTPDIDPQLAALIVQSLEKKVEKRPADFAGVRDQLKTIYQRLEGSDYDVTYPEPKAAELLADSLNNRALSYLEMGNTQRAEALLEQALENVPTHPPSTYNLGLLRWRQGLTTDDVLVHAVQTVANMRPADWLPAYLLAQVHVQRGDFIGACEVLQRVVGRPGISEIQSLQERIHSRAGRDHALFDAAFEEMNFGKDFGADDRVLAVCPKAGLLAVQRADNRRLALVRLSDWRLIREWDLGEKAGSMKVSFSPDGHLVLQVSDFRQVMEVWPIEALEPIRCIKGPRDESGYDFHTETLAVCEDGGVYVAPLFRPYTVYYSPPSDTRLHPFLIGHAESIRSLDFCPARSQIFTASSDHSAKVWSGKSGQCTYTHFLKDDAILCGSLTPDGSRVILGTRRGKILIRYPDCSRQYEITLATEPDFPVAVASDASGSVLVSHYLTWSKELDKAINPSIRIWDIPGKRCIRTIDLPVGYDHSSLALVPHPLCVLVFKRDQPPLGWRIPRKRLPAEWRLCRPRPTSEILAEQSESERLLQEARQRMAQRKYEAAYRLLRQAQTLPEFEFDRRIAALLADLHARGRPSGVNRFFPGDSVVLENSVAIAAIRLFDGAHGLVGAMNGTVAIWNLSNGTLSKHLGYHGDRVVLMEVATAAQRAGTVGAEGDFRLWDLAAKTCVCHFPASRYGKVFESVALSQDGRMAYSSDGHSRVYVWNLELEEIDVVVELGANQKSTSVLGVSPRTGDVVIECDGSVRRMLGTTTSYMPSRDNPVAHRLAQVSFQGNSVFVDEAGAGRRLAVIDGHQFPVTTCDISEDGRTVISGDAGGTLRLWTLDWELTF
jgi:serine/threonine protein kinase/WD40 repeat protein